MDRVKTARRGTENVDLFEAFRKENVRGEHHVLFEVLFEILRQCQVDPHHGCSLHPFHWHIKC